MLGLHSPQGSSFGKGKDVSPYQRDRGASGSAVHAGWPGGVTLVLVRWGIDITPEWISKNPESKRCFVKGVQLLPWHSRHWLQGPRSFLAFSKCACGLEVLLGAWEFTWGCYLNIKWLNLTDKTDGVTTQIVWSSVKFLPPTSSFSVGKGPRCNPWGRILSSLTPLYLKAKQNQTLGKSTPECLIFNSVFGPKYCLVCASTSLSGNVCPMVWSTICTMCLRGKNKGDSAAFQMWTVPS